ESGPEGAGTPGSRQRRALKQEDIQPSVVVTVEERATAAHGFHIVVAPAPAMVMREPHPAGCRHIRQGDRSLAIGRRRGEAASGVDAVAGSQQDDRESQEQEKPLHRTLSAFASSATASFSSDAAMSRRA